jgi:hypothetical protein
MSFAKDDDEVNPVVQCQRQVAGTERPSCLQIKCSSHRSSTPMLNSEAGHGRHIVCVVVVAFDVASA